MFYKNDRIAIFIDGVSLSFASKSLNFEVDFKALLGEFAKRGTVVRALYYTALDPDQGTCRLRPLVNWLQYNGFTLVTKPSKEFVDATGRRKRKTNMNLEIAMDAIDLSESIDHVVLFSGDGDLRRLVQTLQRKGVRVTAVSTLRTEYPVIADELRRQADSFIELDSLKELIAWAPREVRAEEMAHEDLA